MLLVLSPRPRLCRQRLGELHRCAPCRLLLFHRLYDQRHCRRSRRLPDDLTARPCQTPWYFLIGAGAIMVYALCTSKKAHNVIKTSVDLSRQDEGEESFGSTPIARTLVRFSMTIANGLSKVMPESGKRWIETRFQKTKPSLPTVRRSTWYVPPSIWYLPACSLPWVLH